MPHGLISFTTQKAAAVVIFFLNPDVINFINLMSVVLTKMLLLSTIILVLIL